MKTSNIVTTDLLITEKVLERAREQEAEASGLKVLLTDVKALLTGALGIVGVISGLFIIFPLSLPVIYLIALLLV